MKGITEFTQDVRGQGHTTEAVLSGLVIALAVLFVVQTTAVTPFSSATTDKHLENQQREIVSNTISITHENGELKQTILNWNATENGVNGFDGRENPSDVTYYTNMDADTVFLNRLSETVDTSQRAYNVNLNYYNATAGMETQRLVRSGSPSDNVITVRQPVMLHDSDTLTTQPNTQLRDANSDEFYMSDVTGSDPMYNHVEVEVIIWQR